MKVLNVFCIFACLALVASDSAYYCGRHLASALDSFCDGHLVKRSAPQGSGFAPEWPWMEASRAHDLVHTMRKRGVVDECCDKPCTVEELMTYCN